MESLAREEQEQRWQEMAARVEKVTDKLGMPVDEGIKETVIVLNLLDFPTIMSCEGHADRGVGGPWVDIKPKNLEALEERWREASRASEAARKEGRPLTMELYEERGAARKALETPALQLARRLMDYLILFYQERFVPPDRLLMIEAHLTEFRFQCHGAFLQELVESPQREAKLREYQEEMRAFTAFLKERYFAG